MFDLRSTFLPFLFISSPPTPILDPLFSSLPTPPSNLATLPRKMNDRTHPLSTNEGLSLNGASTAPAAPFFSPFDPPPRLWTASTIAAISKCFGGVGWLGWVWGGVMVDGEMEGGRGLVEKRERKAKVGRNRRKLPAEKSNGRCFGRRRSVR